MAMPTVISEAAIFLAVSFGFSPVEVISRAISEARARALSRGQSAQSPTLDRTILSPTRRWMTHVFFPVLAATRSPKPFGLFWSEQKTKYSLPSGLGSRIILPLASAPAGLASSFIRLTRSAVSGIPLAFAMSLLSFCVSCGTPAKPCGRRVSGFRYTFVS